MTKAKTKNLAELKKIVLNSMNLEEYSVFIFGSKAKKTAKFYSDFDIGILVKKPPTKLKLLKSISTIIKYN